MFLHERVELFVRALLPNFYFLIGRASNSKLLIATLIPTNHVARLVTLATAATVSHLLIWSVSGASNAILI